VATPFTGTGGITKRDAGAWILSGANTYTGNTVVSDGTLTVNSSGSLRFRPTTNGVNNSVSGSANATLTFSGTVSLDLSAATAAAGNSWTLFNLGSFSGPAPTLAPTAVTTTTLGSFTETAPGVWELPVTGAKWVFKTADGSLTYSAGFSSWAAINAPGGTISQDHDGDGVPNGVEYFMGLSGNSFTSNPVPDESKVVSWPKGASYTGSYGTDYVIQISSDLGITDDWTDVPIGNVTIDGDSVDYDLDTLPSGATKFVRLLVTGP
jgi:autotransporter-associated beta strand protein